MKRKQAHGGVLSRWVELVEASGAQRLNKQGWHCCHPCCMLFGGLAILVNNNNDDFRPMTLRRQVSLTLPFGWPVDPDQTC